jgi:hypothetical protein
VCKYVHLHRLLFGLLLTWLPAHLCAQEAKPPTRGAAVGMFAHSFGFGFDVQARLLGTRGDVVIGASIASLKHPLELKIASAYSSQGGKDYIYDKKNYAYTIAPTIGFSKPIIPKSGYNKVSVNVTGSAGPLITLLKPYYVEVAVPIGGNRADTRPFAYDPLLYNFTNIVGEADFFLGTREIKVSPGMRGKIASMVDFSGSPAYIRGVELGVYADFYPKAPALMGMTANRQWFVGGSVELLIGNTW